MRRRLDLAMTLVGDPRIIFLDEPTTGLDPRSRRTMWQIIRELVAGGVTIFLTTQYLEEADQLADRIAVLDHGRLVAEGTAGRAQAPRSPAATSACSSPTPRGLDAAARVARRGRPRRRGAHPAGAQRRRRPRRCAPCSTGSTREAIEVDELSVHTPDLDDVFLALTGHPDERKEAAIDEHHVLRRDATRRRCCAATSGTCCATRR